MSAAQPELRAAVVVPGAPTPYEIFDVASVDGPIARLRGPLLLEVGEEVTVRVSRGDRSVELRGRVTSFERAGHEAVSVVRFSDDGAAQRLAAITASAG